jgi:putative two-component system response regulator
MEYTGNHETILIVDDNDILRVALVDMLSLAGFKTATASNGRDALLKMEKVLPDLILSDITMPDLDGYAFFDAVRSRTEWLSIPFIFLTARSGKKDMVNAKGLGAEDYLVKPIHRDELLVAIRSRLNRSNELRVAQLREAYEDSLTMLANAIELRDNYTRGHVERVRDYALVMAEQMGWSGTQLDILRYGAILHDIGKIQIRESILTKKGRLSEDEWLLVREHPVIGAGMVRDIPYLQASIPIIRHHHEYWDGSGYPDQLAGKEIPITARIVVVADAFDAMTTDRCYQSAKSMREAYGEILQNSEIRYDPAVVYALEKAWNQGLIAAIFKGNGTDRTS